MSDKDTLRKIEFQNAANRGYELAFGFSIGSETAFKPVYLGNLLCSEITGYSFVHELNETEEMREPFHIILSPSSTPSNKLHSELKHKFEFESNANINEELDNLRRDMRSLLRNDRTVNKSFPGPTFTSDWFLNTSTKNFYDDSMQFIFELITEAEDLPLADSICEPIKQQLQSHHDAQSLLFRPLLAEAVHDSGDDTNIKSMKRVKYDPPTWAHNNSENSAEKGPEISPAIDEPHSLGKDTSCVGNSLIDGFAHLSLHIRNENSHEIVNYPRDLLHLVRFSCFSLYVYMINRYREMTESETIPVPILLNCEGERGHPVADISIDNINLINGEIERALDVGLSHYLKRQWDYDEEDVSFDDRLEEKLKEGTLFEFDEDGNKKHEEIFEMINPDSDVLLRDLSSVMGTLAHTDRYNIYTYRNSVRTLGRHSGLLKPRTGRAKNRFFNFDRELLESIVLSVIEPGDEIELKTLCERLRSRYGIIVGGSEKDREHLDRFGLEIPEGNKRENPLKQMNYSLFKQQLIELGFAEDRADTLTIVTTNR